MIVGACAAPAMRWRSCPVLWLWRRIVPSDCGYVRDGRGGTRLYASSLQANSLAKVSEFRPTKWKRPEIFCIAWGSKWMQRRCMRRHVDRHRHRDFVNTLYQCVKRADQSSEETQCLLGIHGSCISGHVRVWRFLPHQHANPRTAKHHGEHFRWSRRQWPTSSFMRGLTCQELLRAWQHLLTLPRAKRGGQVPKNGPSEC